MYCCYMRKQCTRSYSAFAYIAVDPSSPTEARFTRHQSWYSSVNPLNWKFSCSGNLRTLYESEKEECKATQNLITFSWDT